MSSAVVLSSGGINSAVVLEIALRTHRPEPIHMLSFKYDALHNEQECLTSLDLYNYHLDKGENITWDQIELPNLFNEDRPPFLDAVMLSMAATYALTNEVRFIYTGMSSLDMLGIFGSVAIIRKIELKFPALLQGKAEIIKRAYDLEVPINLTWSCKQPVALMDDSGYIQCGECSSCKERIHGFNGIHVVDPMSYAIELIWHSSDKSWPYIGEKQLRAGAL